MVDRCATIAIVADFDIDTGASGRLTEVIGLGVLTRLIDRDTVDEVLAKADRRETRVRLLPARVVVYLVLALCLFTADGYDEVVRKLTNGLRGLRIWQDDWKVPTPSAISQRGWPRSGCSCIRPRPGSCSARTRVARGFSSTRASRSWDTRSGRDWQGTGKEPISWASLQRSAETP